MDPFAMASGGLPAGGVTGGDAGPSSAFSDATQSTGTNTNFGTMVVGAGSSFAMVAMVGIALVVMAWLVMKRKT